MEAKNVEDFIMQPPCVVVNITSSDEEDNQGTHTSNNEYACEESLTLTMWMSRRLWKKPKMMRLTSHKMALRIIYRKKKETLMMFRLWATVTSGKMGDK